MARIIVRIELTPAAKERFSEVAGRFGMTQIETTSRVVEWFAGQGEGVQAAVLGQFPQTIESDVARLLLGQMDGKGSTSNAVG